MVQRDQGAIVGGGGELVSEPVELCIGEFAVVVAGDGGVEGDDAQTADVVHPIERFGGFGFP